MVKLRETTLNFLGLLVLTHTTIAEFWSATMLFWMGMLLAVFPRTLDTTVPIYAILHGLMDEYAWAALFFAAGITQSAANIFRWSAARKFMASVTTLIFMFLAICGAMAHPPSFFLPIFGTSFVAMAFVSISLMMAREAKKRDSGVFKGRVHLDAGA